MKSSTYLKKGRALLVHLWRRLWPFRCHLPVHLCPQCQGDVSASYGQAPAFTLVRRASYVTEDTARRVCYAEGWQTCHACGHQWLIRIER